MRCSKQSAATTASSFAIVITMGVIGCSDPLSPTAPGSTHVAVEGARASVAAEASVSALAAPPSTYDIAANSDQVLVFDADGPPSDDVVFTDLRFVFAGPPALKIRQIDGGQLMAFCAPENPYCYCGFPPEVAVFDDASPADVTQFFASGEGISGTFKFFCIRVGNPTGDSQRLRVLARYR